MLQPLKDLVPLVNLGKSVPYILAMYILSYHSCYFRIDEQFLDNSTPQNAYRLETFRSAGSISVTASQQLRCYFIFKCDLPPYTPTSATKTDIRSVSDPVFLEKATPNTLDIYQKARHTRKWPLRPSSIN